ncbi:MULTISPECIES: TIGR02452 family protein [Saccharibacillus]|uniref:TIGR02452 family protein n=1 Tax=Saccharibacillus TaxID=456492 RepID=UPI00123C258E|nr:TIGR02452 family protein [Saccharibacillus sp. WB 17]MWJ32584.1 TIGR02452 family protein [Saccharibacillus sp. WB 17]
MNERTQGQAGGSREKARDRMRRTAAGTVEIARSGVYAYRGQTIDIRAAQRLSEENSRLITPERGAEIVRTLAGRSGSLRTDYRVVNESAVKTVRELAVAEAGRGDAGRDVEAGEAAIAGAGRIGLLNFASAKNPGGGFLNGATAQEENLAISSGLYLSQLRNAGYYDANRACGSMMYTHHAIYSPDVVFFRDERFELSPPICASILTLPAVNYGQVLLKGEDADQAKVVMLERMRLALAIFAERGDRTIVLGAYGCGVFRNDPAEVASWWRRLLDGEGWSAHFEQVVFAVLDRSQDGRTLRPFERIWGRAL